MRSTRRRTSIVALAAGASLFAATGTAAAQDAPAAPPPTVTGASGGDAEVLHLRLGADALDLRVLTESSETRRTDDGSSEAVERLTALTAASSALPGVDSLSTPPLESRSAGEEQSVASEQVDLADRAAAGPLDGLLTGTLQTGLLRSVVDDRGALAALEGAASDLAIFGGLLRLDGVQVGLGSNAFTTDVGALRGMRAERIEVLDLDALLQALGLSLGDLPLGTVAGLLDQLGIPLPGGVTPEALVATVQDLLGEGGGVPAQVAGLRAQVEALTGELAPLTTQVDSLTAERAAVQGQLTELVPLDGACDPAAPILGALGIGCAQVASTVDTIAAQVDTLTATIDGVLAEAGTVQAQIDALLAQIDALLDGVLDLLTPVLDMVGGFADAIEDAPLLALEDVEVGMLVTAAPTIAESVSELTGSIGAFRVGGVALPGTDLLAGADQVTAIAGQLTSAIGEVLGTIDPSLAQLVDVRLLQRDGAVSGTDGATEAVGSLTGLQLQVTPPDLCAVLGRLAAPAPALGPTLRGLVGGLGQSLPELPVDVTGILGGLGATVDCGSTAGAGTDATGGDSTGAKAALTEPLAVDAFTVTGRAAFGAAEVPEPTAAPQPGALARTGLSAVALYVGGAAALAAAVAMRRVVAAAR